MIFELTNATIITRYVFFLEINGMENWKPRTDCSTSNPSQFLCKGQNKSKHSRCWLLHISVQCSSAYCLPTLRKTASLTRNSPISLSHSRSSASRFWEETWIGIRMCQKWWNLEIPARIYLTRTHMCLTKTEQRIWNAWICWETPAEFSGHDSEVLPGDEN